MLNMSMEELVFQPLDALAIRLIDATMIDPEVRLPAMLNLEDAI